MTDSAVHKQILENQLAILNLLVEPYDDEYRKMALECIRGTLRALSEMKRT